MDEKTIEEYMHVLSFSRFPLRYMICLYYKTACTVAEDTRKNYKYFNEGKEKEKPAYF
ncbi:hypothetical protein ABE132_19425 [Peribacillus simplex]|uniref:hypothetical protein n=1 Tax=Peribacillus simplex TaxID=1478 RepID=UPI003D2A037D